MASSGASELLVRLIELGAQLRDGSAQELEFRALLVAQFDSPIPRLIDLSHRSVFAARRRAPAGSSMALPSARTALCTDSRAELAPQVLRARRKTSPRAAR